MSRVDNHVFDEDMDYEDYKDGFRDSCPNCHRSYEENDYYYQICSKCGWDAENDVNVGKTEPTNNDYLNGDADVITGQWY